MPLAIRRKCGESVQIGDNIIVRVERTTNNSCSLIIDAPSEINIARSELLEESEAHGSKHDASHMGGDGQGGPFVYDCDPPLLVGKHAL